MKLRFLVDYPQPNVGVQYAAGDVVDLSAAMAAHALAGGYAEVVAGPTVSVDELSAVKKKRAAKENADPS